MRLQQALKEVNPKWRKNKFKRFPNGTEHILSSLLPQAQQHEFEEIHEFPLPLSLHDFDACRLFLTTSRVRRLLKPNKYAGVLRLVNPGSTRDCRSDSIDDILERRSRKIKRPFNLISNNVCIPYRQQWLHQSQMAGRLAIPHL